MCAFTFSRTFHLSASDFKRKKVAEKSTVYILTGVICSIIKQCIQEPVLELLEAQKQAKESIKMKEDQSAGSRRIVVHAQMRSDKRTGSVFGWLANLEVDKRKECVKWLLR